MANSKKAIKLRPKGRNKKILFDLVITKKGTHKRAPFQNKIGHYNPFFKKRQKLLSLNFDNFKKAVLEGFRMNKNVKKNFIKYFIYQHKISKKI